MNSVSQSIESLRRIDFVDALLQAREVIPRHSASFEDPGSIGIAHVSYCCAVQTDKPAQQHYHGVGYRISGAQTTRIDKPYSFPGACGRTGMTAIVPAAEQSSWFSAGAHDMVHFYISERWVSDLATEIYGVDGDAVQLRDAAFHADEAMARFAVTMHGRLRDPEPMAAAELNAIANLVGAHLLRRYSNLASRAPAGRDRKLSDAQLHAVSEYVRAHLDAPLRLSDMAAVAGMGQFRFARAFRAATGESPHRHITQLRIAQAQNLLTGTDLPLSDVAAAVGFSSQSHMTHAFQRMFSISPGRFRLEACRDRATACKNTQRRLEA